MTGSGYQMHTQGRRPCSFSHREDKRLIRSQAARLAACEGYSSDILSGGPHRPDPCWTGAHPFPWF